MLLASPRDGVLVAGAAPPPDVAGARSAALGSCQREEGGPACAAAHGSLARPSRQAGVRPHARCPSHRDRRRLCRADRRSDRRHGRGAGRRPRRSAGRHHATVNNTIARLQRDGLVRSEPYRSIFLTEDGRDLALSTAVAGTAIVIDFLHAIGVCEEIARRRCRGHRAPCERRDADCARTGHRAAAARLGSGKVAEGPRDEQALLLVRA